MILSIFTLVIIVRKGLLLSFNFDWTTNEVKPQFTLQLCIVTWPSMEENRNLTEPFRCASCPHSYDYKWKRSLYHSYITASLASTQRLGCLAYSYKFCDYDRWQSGGSDSRKRKALNNSQHSYFMKMLSEVNHHAPTLLPSNFPRFVFCRRIFYRFWLLLTQYQQARQKEQETLNQTQGCKPKRNLVYGAEPWRHPHDPRIWLSISPSWKKKFIEI